MLLCRNLNAKFWNQIGDGPPKHTMGKDIEEKYIEEYIFSIQTIAYFKTVKILTMFNLYVIKLSE